MRLPARAGVPMAQRTRFFDDATMEATEGGVRQVVILGAGYDGRALRFAHPGVRFFEVDHPQTQSDKQRRLVALGVDLPSIALVGVDLMHGGLVERLRSAGFDPGEATLFTCEGLLPYLVRDANVALLAAAHSIAAPGSRLAVNFHVRPPVVGLRHRLVRRAVDGLLAAIGEARRTAFAPGDPEELLAEAGWQVSHSSVANREADRGFGMWVIAHP
jgi:methyltransferase (TIGR00027 family)